MRVLITGATGLVGKEIVRLCHKKDIAVSYLTTSKSKIERHDKYTGFYWNPNIAELDSNCFQNVDAIIHLAGASVSKRWTPNYKAKIINSRVQSTRLLVNALKGESHSIKQIVSASAIGFYPDSYTNYYEESWKEPSTTFLGEVVKTWENEVDEFSKLGIMVSKIRIGLVLSNKGGALHEISRPVKFGLGAAFGSGKQWQSWIHIKDLADMFLYLIREKITGVFNGVAPNPVSNQELVKTVSQVLNKPFFMPNIPKFFMKSILGAMHIILFESQRVSSKKIENKGFNFEYHHLALALQNLQREDL
ncbi:TIGR01777 family oxidoreductase [Cognatitamlana onchidii]|uniref:TIGR01777 family oxidoreductase n=1 Tax=Cognatitamlana onchidii TaxID=2562860 RepID=UPI0010A6A26E|nr:TIGR01777 family oxidoreductase [Algibacter onchidii]